MDDLNVALATVRDKGTSPDAIARLLKAAEPRRQELIRRLNLAPGGTAALVKMREALLAHIKDHPPLKHVDNDFVHLFASWFNRGFLVLQRIDWTTPANILEKIIRYEQVHAITNWDDLRSRLAPSDRRCYGFFHPQLVDEPLIFVEVALTRDSPAAIAPLLDLTRAPIPATDATTAVFYSISNTQKGLGGISIRQFPDQAGGRGDQARTAQCANLRDAVARSRLRCMARPRACIRDLHVDRSIGTRHSQCA
jgi:malonyl-CoA decarboxylase